MTSYSTTAGIQFPTASFVGWEKLFDTLSRAQLGATNTYPPHNIIKVDADRFLIEIAAAGFKRSELLIELKESILTVTGKKESTDFEEDDYVHRGIGKRDFTKAFTLAEHVKVEDATFADGILTIELQRVVPESERPRQIKIK